MGVTTSYTESENKWQKCACAWRTRRYLCNVSSDKLPVRFYGFRGRRIEWTYFRLNRIQESAAYHIENFRMNIIFGWNGLSDSLRHQNGHSQQRATYNYPRDAMLARVIVIATCLSVCPSVCHAPVLCQNEES